MEIIKKILIPRNWNCICSYNIWIWCTYLVSCWNINDVTDLLLELLSSDTYFEKIFGRECFLSCLPFHVTPNLQVCLGGNFTGKRLCWNLFLIKLKESKTPKLMFSREISQIFQNTFYAEHLY